MPTDRNLPKARSHSETVYDAGLREFFRNIYNNLALGLAFTGAVAWLVASSSALMHLFFGNTIVTFVVVFSPMFILMFGLTPRRIATMSAAQMAGFFYGLSALIGVSFATIFYLYSGESIARVFFITAGTFAGTSIIGHTSKRDLTSVGSFGLMGLWGVIFAYIVNLFMHSPNVMYVSSMIGVIASVCLIMWRTQMFKEIYSASASREDTNKVALMAALVLYINFINLFQFLLNLMGGGRRC